MSFRRSSSPPNRRGLGLVLGRSRSSVESWSAASSPPTRSPKPLLPFCTSPSHLEDITLELDPADNTSPYSDSIQSLALGSRSMCGRTAKEYEEQLRVLKKENFNLKLRIYFLEERMTKLGRPGLSSEDADAERKLIELKVELETMKREMKSKQVLLAQASKAIELMEEQHSAEVNKLRQELQELEARVTKGSVTIPHMQQKLDPFDNSMQLYVDAFNIRQSMLMPPPPSAVREECGQGDAQLTCQDPTTEHQQQIQDLSQQLQQCMAELDASRERERNLLEALDSKEPDIQIKIQELNHKDAMLEEQRKIIVEIEIKLDEKQKLLESLRQQLEATQATVARHEAEQSALRQQLNESTEKRNKALKVVQTMMAKNNELSSKLREATERRSKAEWEARQNSLDELGEMASDETERLWAELDQQRKLVERLTKENSSILREKAATEQALRKELADARLLLDRANRPSMALANGSGELGSTAKMMYGRLDELAAFLSTLLRYPHRLAGFSPVQRTNLLQAVHHAWKQARHRYSLSLSLTMQPDDCDESNMSGDVDVSKEDAELVGQLQSFLKGSGHEDLSQEVAAELERSVEMWPMSFTSDLKVGKEIELINWEASRPAHEEDEDEGEEGGGATAVEREPPGSHNQSESEAWSEPDRSVSQARIGLPESCTPVSQPERTAFVSPASSEADHTTRTPGKRASVRRLANRLRDSEQINEALRAELSAYQTMVKHSSPVNTPTQFAFPAASVLHEMESQRSRLESLLKQNDVIRQQLEHARLSTMLSSKGDDLKRLREVQSNLDASQIRVQELEEELATATKQCHSLEVQLTEREAEHTIAVSEVQEALAELKRHETDLQLEVDKAHEKCQNLEQQAEALSARCWQLEQDAAKELELHRTLAQQLHDAETERDSLQAEIAHHMEMASKKPVLMDCSVQTTEKPALTLDNTSFGNSTGPSSLIHLSDCDDVFHTDATLGEQSGMGAMPLSPNVETDNQRQALSSPDLGIESDTGRMSSMETPPSPPAEGKGQQSEMWRLKQRLAKSEQLMEACLTALRHKNKTRKQVEASMKLQLQQTEEVLCQAKANLRSLASPIRPQPAVRALPSCGQH